MINKDSIIREEFEAGVIRSFINDIMDIDYCMTKLHLQTEEDFFKVVERYENGNK